MAPVTMKALRQPAHKVIGGTMSGAMIAPMLEPLLQIPMARVRASGGTQRATALANAGHAPPSPTASRLRKKPRLRGPRAKEVSRPAVDDEVMARVRARPTARRSRTEPGKE